MQQKFVFAAEICIAEIFNASEICIAEIFLYAECVVDSVLQQKFVC